MTQKGSEQVSLRHVVSDRRILAMPGLGFSSGMMFSLVLGFAGATQDVVIDGWRIAVAPAEQQALMSFWAEIGWRAAHLCMAVLMARLGPLAVPVLVMVAGFRMPGYVSSAMSMPLLKSLHHSNADIATVTKLFGFWVALGARSSRAASCRGSAPCRAF